MSEDGGRELAKVPTREALSPTVIEAVGGLSLEDAQTKVVSLLNELTERQRRHPSRPWLGSLKAKRSEEGRRRRYPGGGAHIGAIESP